MVDWRRAVYPDLPKKIHFRILEALALGIPDQEGIRQYRGTPHALCVHLGKGTHNKPSISAVQDAVKALLALGYLEVVEEEEFRPGIKSKKVALTGDGLLSLLWLSSPAAATRAPGSPLNPQTPIWGDINAIRSQFRDSVFWFEFWDRFEKLKATNLWTVLLTQAAWRSHLRLLTADKAPRNWESSRLPLEDLWSFVYTLCPDAPWRRINPVISDPTLNSPNEYRFWFHGSEGLLQEEATRYLRGDPEVRQLLPDVVEQALVYVLRMKDDLEGLREAIKSLSE